MRKGLIILFLIVGSLLSGNPASAADFLLIDWGVRNYAPEEYRLNAKTPALPGSIVNFSVNLFKDKGNNVYQLANLDNYFIRWATQGHVLSEGRGASRLSYRLNKFTNDRFLVFSVQVVEPGVGTVISKEIQVPIFQSPEVSFHRLENSRVSPYAQETFSGLPGQELALLVKPYFFNVNSLSGLNFQWYHRLDKIDNPEKDKFIFKAKLPKNPARDIFSVFVQNRGAELEFARQNFYLSNK